MNIILIAFIIFMVLALLIVFESIRECKQFKITSYTVINESASVDSRLKIAMLADLHNTVFGDNNDELINKIKEYKPDCIIIAGDMTVCLEDEKDNNIETAKFVNRLGNIAPVYYGIGNHERGTKYLYKDMGDNWERYIKSLAPNINILSNENISLTKGDVKYNIYGLDIPGKNYKRLKKENLDVKYLIDNIGTPNKGYNILIAHNPDYFDVYEKWGANLVLSGHNHGGLVRLPLLGGVISPRLHLFPKYSYGRYHLNTSQMILTNGLGSHSMKIRVNNVPEVVFIQIKENKPYNS